jgi:P27 family predicted phage terminase small subunit
MSAQKPNELKRKLGNPGKQKLPELATITLLHQVSNEAPLHLTPETQKLWINIREIATWIGNTDKSILTLLCEKIDRRSEYIAKLQSMDLVLYTDKGYAYSNPVVGMISTIENEITKLFSLLGLTPSDRSKLGVAEVQAISAIDKLLAKREARK